MKDLNCETSKEEALTAFMQVLEIDNSMAEFFLEGTAWNIEVAVMHYLEKVCSKSSHQANSLPNNSQWAVLEHQREVAVERLCVERNAG